MRKITYIFLTFFTLRAAAQEVIFTLPDAIFEAGQAVEMPCRAFGFQNMAAFQWGILFDTAALKLDSVKVSGQLPEYTTELNFAWKEISQSQFIKPGSLYTLWTGVPCRTLEEGSKIFTAFFTGKKSGSLGGSIIKYPEGIAFEAINCDFVFLDMDIVFVSATTKTDAPQTAGITVSPNPFSDSFSLNQSGLLILRNQVGGIVLFGQYAAGDPVGQSLAPGVYFGTIGNRIFKIVKQ